MRDGLPDLFGDERHKRVQQAQELVKDIHQNLLRRQLALFVLAVKSCLGEFDIPVAIGIPDKVVDLGGGDAQLVRVHVLRDFFDERIELGEHPLVLDLKVGGIRKPVFFDGQVHEHITARVPDLIGEVAHGLALLDVEAHVVAGRVAGDEVEAQGVRAVFLGHFQRVDAVAEGLGHLAALIVADKAVDEDGLERLLFHLLHAGDDHARHPEEDDIIARNHVGRRVPVFEVFRIQIGPAER